MSDSKPLVPARLSPLSNLIFASRWLQLPLYLGLILAQGVYVVHFWVELMHLIEAAFGDANALQKLVSSIGYKSDVQVTALNETIIMLVVLALIDVVMISNLLIMVIVGGYETFVSRLNLEGHPDQPEWLSHVNASVLKVKLATAIIGISSIHLLKTFINAANYTDKVLLWQTVIHIAFLLLGAGHRAVGPADDAQRQERSLKSPRGPSPVSKPFQSHCHDHHPLRRPRRQRRRRAAVHQLLPPGRLHRPPGARLRRRAKPGRQGRDRADPHQLEDVRRRPAARSARTPASSTCS